MGILSLLAELGLNIKPFIGALLRAKTATTEFVSKTDSSFKKLKGAISGSFLLGAGSALVGAGALLAKNVVEYGGHVSDLADQVNLTTEEVQKLDYIAGQTGASFEDLALALKKIAVAQDSAINGNEDLVRSFEKFGIKMSDLRNMSADQIFRTISDKVKDSGDSSKFLVSMLDLMGKRADVLLPAMKAGVGNMIDEFDRLGLSIENGVIQKLDRMGDEWDQLMRKMKTEAAPVVAGFWDTAKITFKAMMAGLKGEGAIHTLIDEGKSQFFQAISDSIDSAITKPARSEIKPDEKKENISKPTNEPSISLPSNQRADSLAQIGGFIGGASSANPVGDFARQVLRELKAIEKNTDPTDVALTKFFTN